MHTRLRSILLRLASPTVFAACTLPVADPSQESLHAEEDVATSNHALSGRFHWNRTSGFEPLIASGEHFCALTRFQGQLFGDEQLQLVTWDDHWQFAGSVGATSNLRATASCVPLSAFKMPEGSHPVSPWPGNFSAWSTGRFGEECSGPDDTNLGLLTNQAVGIAGFGGPWATSFASVTLHARTGEGERSFARMTSCSQDEYHRTYFGLLTTHAPPKYLKGGVRGTASDANVYHAGRWLEPDVRWLTPVKDALCVFTGISGRFVDKNDYVMIDIARDNDGVRRWRLRTSSGKGASARCLAFDQR
jgi:hypothetical protein